MTTDVRSTSSNYYPRSGYDLKLNIASSADTNNTVASHWLRMPFDVCATQNAYEELVRKVEEEIKKEYGWLTRNAEIGLEFSDRGEFCADEDRENDGEAVEDKSLPEFLGTFAVKAAE